MMDFLDLFDLGDGEGDGGLLDDSGGALGIDSFHLGTEAVSLDMDGDGLPDVMLTQQVQDIDGDGIADVYVTEQYVDTDGDGEADTVISDVVMDVDGDGIMDVHSVIAGYDTDGDGIVDYVQAAEDFDNDGLFDSVREFADQDGNGIGDFPEDAGYMDGNAPAYEQFDPDGAAMEHIVGNPAEAMESWHWQETDSSCAVASQEFVLEQLTGQEFEESELRDIAEEHGWYDIHGGTPADDVGNLLEHMGLTVERSKGNTMEDLEHCLGNGGEVIAVVDGLELWLGEDNDLFGPGMDANHAVQVIGVDHSAAGCPMVILNDPGAANGGGAMIPMDIFMGAWEDSGCQMVEAYA